MAERTLAKLNKLLNDPSSASQSFKSGGATVAVRLLECQCILGEGIIYDEEHNAVLWTDIDGKKFHTLDLSSGVHSARDLPKMLGSFALRPKGEKGYLFAWEDGFQLYDVERGEPLSEMSVGEAVNPSGLPTRMNDGRTDPTGKFFISGAFYGDIEDMYVKVFRCSLKSSKEMEENVDDDGVMNNLEHNVLVDKIQVTNSICFSPDGLTMYLADSPTKQINKYDYNTQSGTIANKHLVRTFDVGVPDGSCVDSHGNIWNAVWRNGVGPGMVNCIHPDTGDVLFTVDMPDTTSQITCCCFGGPDLDILFISTASIGRDMEKEPWSGSVYAVKIDGVKGCFEKRFVGN